MWIFFLLNEGVFVIWAQNFVKKICFHSKFGSSIVIYNNWALVEVSENYTKDIFPVFEWNKVCDKFDALRYPCIEFWICLAVYKMYKSTSGDTLINYFYL
jgi:hypothetical protein